MAVVLLVRFGELALKSRFVRRQLRDRLVGNIQDMFASEGLECVTEADEARIYVHTANEARARSILARVFGIVSVSPATETRTDTESLQTLVLAQAEKTSLAGKAFALRVRRVGSHPFTSLDLAKRIGAADPGLAAAIVDAAVERLGRIDILVNNAAVTTKMAPFETLAREVFEETLAVNVTAPFLATQAAARHMIAAGRGGRIVNIGSVHARVSAPGAAAYEASKGGILALTAASAVAMPFTSARPALSAARRASGTVMPARVVSWATSSRSCSGMIVSTSVLSEAQFTSRRELRHAGR